MGRPIMQGNVARGKLSPAKPHFTKPVPLSHTTTLSLEHIAARKREVARNLRREGYSAGSLRWFPREAGQKPH